MVDEVENEVVNESLTPSLPFFLLDKNQVAQPLGWRCLLNKEARRSAKGIERRTDGDGSDRYRKVPILENYMRLLIVGVNNGVCALPDSKFDADQRATQMAAEL
jgi:hypothetical protein